MATANYSVSPADGWVAVTAAAVSFIKIKSYPDMYSFYVTTGTVAPASTVVGYLVDEDEDFTVNVKAAAGELYYVRVVNPAPDKKVRIDVFTLA